MRDTDQVLSLPHTFSTRLRKKYRTRGLIFVRRAKRQETNLYSELSFVVEA